jgi:hypothetical protein
LTVTEHTGSPWVNASITIRGTLYPNRTYDVSVVQGAGSYCATADSDIVEFTTDSSGKAPDGRLHVLPARRLDVRLGQDPARLDLGRLPVAVRAR